MQATGKIWVFYNTQSGKQTKPMPTVQAQMALLSLKPQDLNTIHIWTPGWESWQAVERFLKSEQRFFVMNHPPKPANRTNFCSTKTNVADAIDEITNTISESTNGHAYTQVENDNRAADNCSNTNYGYYHQDFNGNDLDFSKIQKLKAVKIRIPKHNNINATLKRRTNLRHDFKIEIVIISNDKSFRTYSKNISLGGTLLEDEVPKGFLDKQFDLIIINRFEVESDKKQLLFKAKIIGDITDPRRLMFMEVDSEMILRLDALLKAYVTYQYQIKKQAA